MRWLPSDPSGRATVVAILAAAAAGGVTAGVITLLPGGAGAQQPATTPVREADVGGSPIAVAVTGGKVWLLDRVTPRLRAVSARTLRPVGRSVRLRPPHPADPIAMAAGEGVVWVALSEGLDGRGWLARVDARTGRVRWRGVPFPPEALAAQGRRAWVAGGGTVVLVAGGGRRTLPAGVGHAAALAAGPDGAWALDDEASSGARLVRLAGRRVARHAALGPGVALAVAGDGVWVGNGCGEGTARIPIGRGGARCLPVRAVALAGTPAGVWALDERGDLARLHPRGLRVLQRMRLPHSADALTVGAGATWVLSEDGTLMRVGPGPRAVSPAAGAPARGTPARR